MAVLELHSFQLEGGRIQAAEPELVIYGMLAFGGHAGVQCLHNH